MTPSCPECQLPLEECRCPRSPLSDILGSPWGPVRLGRTSFSWPSGSYSKRLDTNVRSGLGFSLATQSHKEKR